MLEVAMAATIMYIPGWLRCHEESGLAWSEITNTFTAAECVYHDWDGNRRWRVSLKNSDEEAVKLSDALLALTAAQRGETILVGHSLGGRIVARTLARISASGAKVKQGVLLGAAIPADDPDLMEMGAGSELPVLNFSNEKDVTLKYFYSTLGGESMKPLGSSGFASLPPNVRSYAVPSNAVTDVQIDAAWAKLDVIKRLASHYAPFYLHSLQQEIKASDGVEMSVLKKCANMVK